VSTEYLMESLNFCTNLGTTMASQQRLLIRLYHATPSPTDVARFRDLPPMRDVQLRLKCPVSFRTWQETSSTAISRPPSPLSVNLGLGSSFSLLVLPAFNLRVPFVQNPCIQMLLSFNHTLLPTAGSFTILRRHQSSC